MAPRNIPSISDFFPLPKHVQGLHPLEFALEVQIK